MLTAKCRVCQEEHPGENDKWHWAVVMFRDNPFKGKYEFICAQHMEGYCYNCGESSKELWPWKRKHKNNDARDIRMLCKECLLKAITERKNYYLKHLEKRHTIILQYLHCLGCGKPNTSNESITPDNTLYRYCKECRSMYGKMQTMQRHREHSSTTFKAYQYHQKDILTFNCNMGIVSKPRNND